MKINHEDIRQMIDISLLSPDTTESDVQSFIEMEKRERFICVFVMPCYLPMVVDAFKDDPNILVGGVVGFPLGAETLDVKLYQLKERVKAGADELDVVINIGWLKSKKYEAVLEELKVLVKAAGNKPVKVILEVTLLTDEEIVKGCELVAESGARFVKTGTGTRQQPTTLHHVETMYKTVGDRIGIKAAGGVRDFDTFIKMVSAGVSRFGIAQKSALGILQEAIKYPEGIEV